MQMLEPPGEDEEEDAMPSLMPEGTNAYFFFQMLFLQMFPSIAQECLLTITKVFILLSTA